MTREEKITKLKSIKQCIIKIVATYDIGLEVDFMNAIGAQQSIGNLGQWPCMKLNVSDELRALQQRLNAGEVLTDEELLAEKSCAELCKYHSFYLGDSELKGEVLDTCLQQIRTNLPTIDLAGQYFYAYAMVENWNTQIELFPTFEQLCDYFLSKWGADVDDYDSMDDESLDWWWDVAEETKWDDGIFLITFSDDSEEETDSDE